MKTRENTLDKFIVNEVKSYLSKIQLKKEDNLLDLGGNIGAFVNLVSSKVNKVFTYEPEKENFEILKENNIENKNVYCFNSAVVGNQDKERIFYVNQKQNKGIHGFLAKRGRLEQKVSCVNINDIIKEHNINKIKMDIEGSEYELLKSMNFDMIDEMVIEYHFIYLKDKDKSKYNEIIKLLKRNFKLVKYKEDTKKAWTTIISVMK
jgi:FkbM family methyltransferase